MSSEFRAASQVPANKLYVNVASVASTIFQVDGSSKALWVNDATALGMLSTAGAAVLRDMGKTVFVGGTTSAQKSTVLRKVQLVFPASAANTSVGGDGVTTGTALAGTEFMTGYIHMGGLTAGGTTEVFGAQSARVARLN